MGKQAEALTPTTMGTSVAKANKALGTSVTPPTAADIVVKKPIVTLPKGTPTPTPTTTDDEGSSTLIIIIVIAAIVGVALLIGGVMLYRSKQGDQQPSAMTMTKLEEAEAGQATPPQSPGLQSHAVETELQQAPPQERPRATSAVGRAMENVMTKALSLEQIVSHHVDVQRFLIIFKRHDLDSSGVLKDVEELNGLTTNMVFNLVKEGACGNPSGDLVASVVEGVRNGTQKVDGKTLDEGWSPKDYLFWFHENIEPHLGYED